MRNEDGMTKKYYATDVTITQAENGFVLSLRTYDAMMTLVARTEQEMLELLSCIDWRQRETADRGPVPIAEPAVVSRRF